MCDWCHAHRSSWVAGVGLEGGIHLDSNEALSTSSSLIFIVGEMQNPQLEDAKLLPVRVRLTARRRMVLIASSSSLP